MAVVHLEERVRIATPEGVPLDLVVAGLGSRFLAAMLDTLIIIVLILAPIVGLGAGGALDSGWVEAMAVTWVFLAVFGYYPVAETVGSGRSVGKRAAGIRVVRQSGAPIGFLTSMVRNLLRIVDFLPFFYGVGVAVILVTPRSQRLGDLAAGTYVVRERHPGAPTSGVSATEPTSTGRAGATPTSSSPGAAAPGGTPSDAWAAPDQGTHSALAPFDPTRFDPTRSDPTRSDPEPDRPDADGPAEPWRDWDVSAITPEETALARRFLQRRWTIEPHARVHLASELARRLHPKVPGAPSWPDETVLECIVAAKSARG